MLPPSSMPKPYWFLRQTATITPRTTSQESAGSWDQNASSTITVLCNVQPSSSSEAAIYKRETGKTMFTIYLDSQTTAGASITTTQLNHISTITVDGIVYQTDGEFLNLCSHDVVYQMNVYREV